jgi:hypothetical protein
MNVEWINVMDKLPNTGDCDMTEVLVWDRYEGAIRALFFKEFPYMGCSIRNVFTKNDHLDYLFHVTHWMPLLEKPTDDNEYYKWGLFSDNKIKTLNKTFANRSNAMLSIKKYEHAKDIGFSMDSTLFTDSDMWIEKLSTASNVWIERVSLDAKGRFDK